MFNAYEMAIKIIHWYKDFDLYDYRDLFSDSETREMYAKILARDLASGNTKDLIAFLTDCREEVELPEEKKEIIELINMIKSFREIVNET